MQRLATPDPYRVTRDQTQSQNRTRASKWSAQDHFAARVHLIPPAPDLPLGIHLAYGDKAGVARRRQRLLQRTTSGGQPVESEIAWTYGSSDGTCPPCSITFERAPRIVLSAVEARRRVVQPCPA